MNSKKIVSIILGIFVIISVVYLAITSLSPNSSNQSSTQNQNKEAVTVVAQSKAIPVTTSQVESQAVQKGKVVNGLYFHGTNRCYTCNLMEGYIRDVIKESFSKEISEKRLTFQNYNVDEPAYNHYIRDYQLQSISLFLSLTNDGKEEKYENINKIWQLAKNETMFKNYIRSEIKRFLEM